jgi:undecaprenyl-diphosphatase
VSVDAKDGAADRTSMVGVRSAVGLLGRRSVAGLAGLVLGALLLYTLSGAVVALDRAVAAALNGLVAPHPSVVALLRGVTRIGDTMTGVVVLSTLALYLLARERRRLVAFVLVTGVGALALGTTVKALVGRVRPIVEAPVATAPGASFPSGHTLTTTVTVGVLLLVLLPTAPVRARRALIGCGAMVIAVVAFTRIALGVHFLSDVVGGAALGIGWLAVTAAAFRDRRRQEGLAVPPVRDGLEPEAAAKLAPAPSPEPDPVRRGTVAAQLAVVAVVLLGVLLGAGLLITRLLPGTGIEHVDREWVQDLAGNRIPVLDDISGPAAELGNTGVVIAVGVVAAVLAVAHRRQWRPAALLAVLLVGELGIFMAAATVIGRPRPPVAHLDAQLPPTSSFPSGHTSAAICLYGAIAALVLTASRAWWRWLVLALAVAVVVVVALARLYRGAHYPSDVIGSVLFAVPWLLITLRLVPLEPERARPTDRD